MQNGGNGCLHRAITAENLGDCTLCGKSSVTAEHDLDGHTVARAGVQGTVLGDDEVGIFFGGRTDKDRLAALHDRARDFIGAQGQDAHDFALTLMATGRVGQVDEYPIALPCLAGGIGRNKDISVFVGCFGCHKAVSALGGLEHAGQTAVMLGMGIAILLVFEDLALVCQLVECLSDLLLGIGGQIFFEFFRPHGTSEQGVEPGLEFVHNAPLLCLCLLLL